MKEDDDWEELDENAMEECMVLATQLCSKQPLHITAAAEGQNTTQQLKTQNSKNFSEVDSRRQSNLIYNENHGSVNDSGVSCSRSSNWHPSIATSSLSSHPPISNTRSSLNQLSTTSNTAVQKREPPQNSYRSRFSDFSANTNNTGLHHTSLTRKSSSSGRGQIPQVTSTKGSPRKARSPAESIAVNAGSGENVHLLLQKAQEEKKNLDERIIVMQGEISLLRSELKRKETALEAERLDHCAAIEAAEKRGREKVAKQAAETDTKLKENGVLLDKLQGELHFKKREVEELMHRCHQLEQQSELSQTPGPANKRPRIERTVADSSMLSRFDFGVKGAAKVCSVEVQTESYELQKVERSRLDVALPRGRICHARSIATLLSSCAQASTSVSSAPLASRHGNSDSWSLPSEWLTLISQALRKSDDSVKQKLVALAVERLLQTHGTISDDDVNRQRGILTFDDPREWYESQVGPAIQILLHFKSSSELSALRAISTHLPPLNCKDVVVNKRMHMKLMEAAEMVLRNIKCPMEKTHCEALLSLLRECCESIDGVGDARKLLQLTSALTPHGQLCSTSGACLIGKLCKKVKKLCIADLETLSALLDLTQGVVKVAPASSCLTSSCPCSSQLLGTVLWHMYQVLESSHHAANKRRIFDVVASCIPVLHHWSVIDPDWWDKVSHFPQYPVLMVTIAAKAKDISFDRDTVDLLCDLYEFEERTFER